MWNWFNCYLSGRHEYGVWCEPGAIFLRCVHCGRRSPGWAVEGKAEGAGKATGKARGAGKPGKPGTATIAHRKTAGVDKGAIITTAKGARVIPFNRTAVS
jgi:hypothetical protein